MERVGINTRWMYKSARQGATFESMVNIFSYRSMAVVTAVASLQSDDKKERYINVF